MEKKVKITGRDILGYLLLGISVMMLGKSLMLCFSDDIWYDELFTVGMAEHSYGDLIGFTSRDVHPPLYYCIVKLAVDLCKLISAQASAVVAAKTVSVLPYFILLLYSVTFIRRKFGILAGGMFLFCTVAMPQLSGYTVEMRMYSLALLFVTAAFLHAYGTVNAPEAHMRHMHGAALVFYGLAAAYTQYFACVAVIMVYLYVFFVFLFGERGRIKEWLVWAGVSAVGYAPWLYVLLGQVTAVNENYWILPLTWRSLGGCVKFLMKPAFANGTLSTVLAVVMFCIYVFVAGYVLIVKLRGDKVCYNGRENGICSFVVAGTGVLAGLVLFGFAASILLRPIFVYRYMIPAMGCFWLSFAVGVQEIAKSSTKSCRLIFYAVLLFTLTIGLRDYRAFMGEEEYKILLMRQTEAALDSIAPEDAVIYNFDQVQAVASYYLDEGTESYLWNGTPEVLIQDIMRPYGTVESAAQITAWCRDGRRVWFIGSFNSREDIVAEWEAEDLNIEETGSYLLERYWFNLYKISL